VVSYSSKFVGYVRDFRSTIPQVKNMEEINQESSEITATLPPNLLGRGGFFGRNAWLGVVIIAVVGVLLLPGGVDATTFQGQVIQMVGQLFSVLVSLVGQLLLLLVGMLITVAGYNGFVDSTAVATGWVITRDIANMFFIVALLLIAFGTILGFSSYHYSGTLPRLVIMAVVINFSRTICGLIIDFSQVIMLTFVNGFREAAAGNFINAFGLGPLLRVEPSSDPDAQEDLLWGVTLSLMLAFLLVTIATGVIVIMISVLVVRIVYLWLLVVMSPLAFMASAAPISMVKGFYTQWWEKFNKQVAVGPLLAFFLWLALISVNDAGGQVFSGASGRGESLGGAVATSFTDNHVAETLQSFIIAIGMLLGGVSMAQSMSGGAVGFGQKVLRGAGKFALGATKRISSGAYRVSGADRAVDRAKERGFTALGVLSGSSYFRNKAALQRKNIAQKSAADAEATGYMTPAELKREMSKPALTNKARAQKKAAYLTYLKRAGDPTDSEVSKIEDPREFHKMRKEAERLGAATHDPSMKKAFDDYSNKHIGVMVDPDASGEERKKQISRFNGKCKNMSAVGLREAGDDELTPQALMQIRAGLLNDEFDGMGETKANAVLEGLGIKDDNRKKFLEADMLTTGGKKERLDLIKEHQEKIKKEDKSFEYLSDKEKSARFVTSKNVNGKDLRSADVAEIKAAGLGKIAAMDPSLFKDGELAHGVGQAYSAEEIKRLPKEIGDEVRKALLNVGQEDEDKYLAAGGNIEAVIPGLDSSTGNVRDEAGRERLEKWMSQGKREDKIKLLPPELLLRNGGVNDVAIAAAQLMDSGELNVMAKHGDRAQAAAMVSALKGIAAVKDPEQNRSAGKSLRLKDAQKNAKAILEEVKRGDTLSASLSDLKFVNRAGKAIAKNIENVSEGIAEVAKTDLGNVAAEIGESAAEAKRSVVRSARGAGISAARQARSLRGRLGAARRRLF